MKLNKSWPVPEMIDYNYDYLHLVDRRNEKRMTIKQTIEVYINTLEPNTQLHAKSLWWSLFRYKVARGSVTRALSQLAKEGKVEKSEWARGKNSEWKVL